MAEQIITANELASKVCEALGISPNRVRRVVLDLEADQPVMVYVEMVGDSRLLDIQWTLNGAQIEFADKKPDDSEYYSFKDRNPHY